MHEPRAVRASQLATRAATALVLAAFVLTTYVVVVLLGGRLVGHTEAHPHLMLSVVATAVIAVLLEPFRRRVQPWLRRVVGGQQTTPYDVLTRFGAQVSGAYALDEVAPRMAHVLATGTGSADAEVWVVLGSSLHRAAVWPGESAAPSQLVLDATRQLSVDPPADAVVPVGHSGELLGALVVRKPPGEPLTSVERGLVTDLARQAGLVLRNVALATQLQARLQEISLRSAQLAGSRARLVRTQDEERRRLERDIHDGAQQHLVALVVSLRLVQTLLGRAPDRAAALLANLEGAVARADRTLRELARGVYPRTLTERGVVAALAEVLGSGPLDVDVSGTAQRYPEQQEAAAYFCCLEAVQNAAKHARATRVTVEVRDDAGQLAFTVSDDGRGFDAASGAHGSGLANMADRAETLGGTLSVSSTPGAGTVVRGALPTAARAA